MSIAAVLLGLIIYCSLSNAFVFRQHNASWIVNYPHSFGIFQMMNHGEKFEHVSVCQFFFFENCLHLIC